MKKEEKHIFKRLQQIGACFMLLIFLSMPTLQVVHFHDQSAEVNLQAHGKTVIDELAEQCKLCDFLAHKQFKEFHLPSATTFLISTVQPVKIYGSYIAINYTFTLNGFTNKGPPTTFC